MVVILANKEQRASRKKQNASICAIRRIALFRTVIVIRRLLVSSCSNASPKWRMYGTNGNIQSGQLATIDQSGDAG
ncbi:hypothetical protein WJX77_011784 [Trebouxia sp. C0004]